MKEKEIDKFLKVLKDMEKKYPEISSYVQVIEHKIFNLKRKKQIEANYAAAVKTAMDKIDVETGGFDIVQKLFRKQHKKQRINKALLTPIIEAMTTSPHRAVYTFKNPEEYRKAWKLLNQGVSLGLSDYDYNRVDSLRQITVPEGKHELIEKLWAKNGIKNYERSSSEIKF